MSPMIGDAGGARAGGDGVRLRDRCAGCRARAPARATSAKSRAREVDDRHAGGGRLLAPRRRVIPGKDAGAALLQRLGGDEARARQPQHRHRLVPECRRPRSCPRLYRSFKVESPASASTEAMIQKRMTMVGSCQPFFSK